MFWKDLVSDLQCCYMQLPTSPFYPVPTPHADVGKGDWRTSRIRSSGVAGGTSGRCTSCMSQASSEDHGNIVPCAACLHCPQYELMRLITALLYTSLHPITCQPQKSEAKEHSCFHLLFNHGQYREKRWRPLWFCVCTIAAAIWRGCPSTPSTSPPCHTLCLYEVMRTILACSVVMGVSRAPS